MANYAYVTGTTQVKSSPGKLYGIFCSDVPSGETFAVFDSNLGLTANIIIGPVNLLDGYYNFNPGIYFSHGLYIVTSVPATISVTFIYD
jgi:hypothetical protein